ncbi:MAG: response regulator [Ignavibacteriales bacterium]|nr:response regulator [Ignavibacteriales bacterium]
MKKGSTILIVDDDEVFRQLLIDALGERGYKLLETSSSEIVLEMLEKQKPDMAIIDVDLPTMNGIELTKAIKEQHPQFPIVMITGYAALYSPADVLATGVEAFLQKPITMDKLMSIIAQL